MNIDKTKTIPVRQESVETPVTLTQRGRVAVALASTAASLIAGVGTGVGINKVVDKSEYHEVGTTEVMVEQGGTLVGAVDQGVDALAEQHNFDANKVPGEVAEAQEVGGEIEAITGKETIDPGTKIDVTVSENDFGKYKVEADPAEPQN